MMQLLRGGAFPLGWNLRTGILVLAVLCGTVAACENKSPTAPASPPPTNNPPPAPTPTVVALSIVVPPTIAPGESAQLTANARKSDGTVEDVTSQTSWSTSNIVVLAVNSSGLASGKAAGDVSIFGRYQSRSASAQTLVVPKGTFRLTGRVSEAGVGLENATVSVESGVGQGLASTTNQRGEYAIYGVSGSVRLRAKKDGYADRLETIDVTANRSFDLDVVPDRPRAALAGTYTLSIDAGACKFGGGLPSDVMSRTFTATLTQDGARLAASLSGATFIVTRGRGDHFAGFVEPNGTVTFALGDVYYDYYYDSLGQHDLVERFNDSSVYIAEGIVTAKVTSAGISGTLSGEVALGRGLVPPFRTLLSSCYADAHRFEFVRR